MDHETKRKLVTTLLNRHIDIDDRLRDMRVYYNQKSTTDELIFLNVDFDSGEHFIVMMKKRAFMDVHRVADNIQRTYIERMVMMI